MSTSRIRSADGDIVSADAVACDDSGNAAHGRSVEQAECHENARKLTPKAPLSKHDGTVRRSETVNAYSAVGVAVPTRTSSGCHASRVMTAGSCAEATYCLCSCTVGPVSLVPVLVTQSVRKVWSPPSALHHRVVRSYVSPGDNVTRVRRTADL